MHSHSIDRARPGVLIVLAAVLAIAAMFALAGSPSPASASTKCSISAHQSTHMGTSYVTSLKVVKTTCKKGKKLVKAFNACRKANGGKKGKCPSVKGYSCTEKRNGVPGIQYSSKARCKKGAKVVKFSYTQNL